jgi:hypothetical protein
MPELASISDQVRAVFPNAQFLHGEENGREIGKFPALPAGVVEIDAVKAMEMAKLGTERRKRK